MLKTKDRALEFQVHRQRILSIASDNLFNVAMAIFAAPRAGLEKPKTPGPAIVFLLVGN